MPTATDSRRRRLLTGLAPALAAVWLGARATRAGALDAALRLSVTGSLTRIDQVSRALRAGEARPTDWQDAVEAAAAAIDLDELFRAIDFERLRATAGYAEVGVATAPARLPDVFGDGRRPAYYAKVFAVGKGRAVIPHGHAGMVSGHLVLDGGFRLRQYDRVGDEPGRMLIRPTVDRVETAGGCSTISDDRDNVHWLVAESDAHTLDFLVTGVAPETPGGYAVQNIDPAGAEDRGDGVLAAPHLDVETALAKYG